MLMVIYQFHGQLAEMMLTVDVILPGLTSAEYVFSNGEKIYHKPGHNKMKM